MHTSRIYEFSADKLFVELSESLQEDAGIRLNSVLSVIQSNHNVQVLIEIHTDSGGTPDFNLLLSQQWARMLQDFFQNNVKPDVRLTVVGMGSRKADSHALSDKTFINGRIVILIQYD